MRVALLCLLSLLLTGCSALFVTAPPRTTARDVEPECTTSAVAPVVDTIVGALQALRTGYALSASDADYADFPISRGADAALGAVLTVAFAASAAYGFSTTSSCSDAKREFRTRPPAERAPSPPGTQPPSAPTPSKPRPFAECTFDGQCAATRVCEQGRCIEYQPSPPSSP